MSRSVQLAAIILVAATSRASPAAQTVLPGAVSDTARTWTVEDAVTAALAQHPLVEAARARADAADHERSNARALPNPIGTFWLENDRPRETSLYLTYPIESMLQRGPRVRRAEEDVRAAAASLVLARRLVAADTVCAFFGVALAQALCEEAEENRFRIEQLVSYTRARVGEGVTAEGELLRLEIELDRAALARYGLSVAGVRATVQAGIGGTEATEIVDGRRRFPVVVRLASAYRGTLEAIGQLMLTTPSGGKVLLSQVARVRVVEGPELINHENGERMVIVQSNVRGRDLGGFAADVQRAVAERVRLPEGYFVTYGGQFENQQRAMTRLAVIAPLVLLLIIALLYASFGNGRQALLVMLNVPFALVGGIAALWVRGLNLNLSASVGFIALFGIAVLNGVVLIAYLNQLRDEGKPLGEAVREGSEIRLRPVLMTALVASFGFIPMAVATSAGSEVRGCTSR